MVHHSTTGRRSLEAAIAEKSFDQRPSSMDRSSHMPGVKTIFCAHAILRDKHRMGRMPGTRFGNNHVQKGR